LHEYLLETSTIVDNFCYRPLKKQNLSTIMVITFDIQLMKSLTTKPNQLFILYFPKKISSIHKKIKKIVNN